MSFSYDYNLNIPKYYAQNPNFRATDTVVNSDSILAKPIEKVTNTIEGAVDTFVPTSEEKKKKSTKTAIAVGSSVLVLSTIVALLNPRYSAKLSKKLSNWQTKAGTKAEKSNKGPLYKGFSKAIGWSLKGLEFSNNFNTGKDVLFKEFCTSQKSFNKVRNKETRKVLKKIDNTFVNIMKKPYNAITNWFDRISKRTVELKYKKASKQMDLYEELVSKYKDKLSAEDQKLLQEKLDRAKLIREHFSEPKLAERFLDQEKSMSELETQFWKRYKKYRSGFSNKWKSKSEHIGNNMTFWAEEIMMPTRNKFENQGKDVVSQLMGDGNGKKGIYEEIFEIIEPNLSKEDVAVKKALQSASKSLKKANHSECVEYFDKKRDLVLGSAPTDVLTAVAGLGLSGIAIGTADNKDERVSRALTGAFPVIAGLGASMAFTAMLFSGVQGMLYGALTSVVLSKLGSMASHHFVGDKTNETQLIAKESTNNQSSNNPFQPTQNMEVASV